MKKIIYLYILIFLSCDPGWFGLEEDLGIYSYHDGIALAWEVFFNEQDYDVAIAYLNSTINEAEDQEYYNSAYTALGWLYLFKSNIFIGEFPDSITAYRDSADSLFLLNIDNEDLAIIGYDTGCYYDFCCSDCFAKDRELGLLYMQIEEYFILSNAEQSSIPIGTLVNDLASFVDANADYDFMNGKPIGNNGETMDFAIDNVRIYLAHVYFRMGQFSDCCDELEDLATDFVEYEDCGLDCGTDADWDYTNLEYLLDCLNPEKLF